jgi:hypothetical protein
MSFEKIAQQSFCDELEKMSGLYTMNKKVIGKSFLKGGLIGLIVSSAKENNRIARNVLLTPVVLAGGIYGSKKLKNKLSKESK